MSSGTFDALLGTWVQDRLARVAETNGPLSEEREAWIARVRSGAATHRGKHVQFHLYCCYQNFLDHLEALREDRDENGEEPPIHEACFADMAIPEQDQLRMLEDQNFRYERLFLRPHGLTFGDVQQASHGKASLEMNYGKPAELE